jgi:hypothetical protein
MAKPADWHNPCSYSRTRARRENAARTEFEPISEENEAMDRRLTPEEVEWLRKMRDTNLATRKSLAVPIHVARKLTMLGCAAFTGRRGEYSITLRGRDELVDRELENEIR